MKRVDRHPEVVAHHDDALHPLAVALPQGFDQFRVFIDRLGMQPLLELVEDDQHLLARRNALVHGEEPPASLSGRGFPANRDIVSADPRSSRASVSSAVAST